MFDKILNTPLTLQNFLDILKTSPILTHFWPMFPFFTPCKYQKTFGFLVFSGGTKVHEGEHWPEIDKGS